MTDWPVGEPSERTIAIDRLPGRWSNTLPFLTKYDFGYHTGIDVNLNYPTFNSDKGKPVYAIADGEITFSGIGRGQTWGWLIIQRCAGFYVRYAHVNHKDVAVPKVGDMVKQGQVLALVSNADGYYGTGDHLHIDISTTDILLRDPSDWPGLDRARVIANYVDPVAFIAARKTVTTPEEPVITKPYVVSNPPGVNFRQWYSRLATVIKLVPDKTPVQGYDLTFFNPDGAWRLVNVDGAIGWMVDTYIKPAVITPPAPVIESIIDISHARPIVDPVAFKAAIASGLITGIIHKATEGDGSDNWIDSTYHADKAAYGPSVLWWAYHFGNGDDPIAQAKNFLNVVKPDGTFGLVLDWESNRGNPMSVAGAQAFSDYVELMTGVKPWIYTGLNQFEIPADSRLKENKLMFANQTVPPTLTPSPWKLTDIAIQQFAQRSVPGITKPVDINRFVGTSEQLAAAHKAVSGKLAVEPPVVTAEKLYVDVDGLYLRPKPERVGGTKYPLGTAVEAIDPVQIGDYLWVRIVGPGNLTGYMARQNTKTGEVYLTSTPPYVPPANAVNIPATVNRIGLHIGSNAPGGQLVEMAKRLKAAGKPLACVTVITEPALANELAPYTTVMFRMVWDDSERYDVGRMDGMTPAQAEQYGRDFYFGEHHASTLEADKAHYIKLVNERGFHINVGNEFWIGAMKAAESEGRKLAIYGDSMSSIEPSAWQKRLPSLRYALANGHAVTLNAYGPTEPDGTPSNVKVSEPEGFQYFGGWPIRLYESVPADARPMLIIGETGQSDSTIDRAFDVAQDAKDYDLMLRQYPYIKGFCYYTVGQWMGKPKASLDYAIPDFEKVVMQA